MGNSALLKLCRLSYAFVAENPRAEIVQKTATMSESQVDDFISRLEVEPETGSVRQVKGTGVGGLSCHLQKKTF